MNRSAKNKIHTVKEKLLLLGKLMGFGLIFSFLISELCGQFIVSRQNRAAEYYKYYSSYVYELEQMDTILNAYILLPTEELRDSFAEALEETVALAALLEETNEPMMRDLSNIIGNYSEEVSKLLALSLDSAADDERILLYREIDSLMDLLKDLLDNQYSSLNQYVSDRREYLNTVNLYANSCIVIFIALLMTGILCYSRDISDEISVPLEALTQRAKETLYDAGELSELPVVEEKTEFDVLTNAFHEMLVRNHAYVEQKIAYADLQTKLTRTELKVLQARVNPHFTFNILNVISGLALEEHADRTAEAVVQTAEYFRYSLTRLDRMVRLKEEFRNIRDYFAIQQLRYEERLHTELSLEEGCEEALICSMVLQPFCENAIQHGIAPRIGGGTVYVSARREDASVVLRVADDGIGMAQERLEQLRQWISHYETYEDVNGIGVVTTYYRMVLAFGPEVHLWVSSRRNEGTEFIVRFPFVTEREKIHDNGNPC